MPDKPNDSISVLTIPFILVLAGIFLFAALIRMETDLLLFTASIIFIAGLAGLWSRFSLKNLDCEFSLSTEKCFPDDYFELKADTRNKKLLPVMVKIRIPDSIREGLVLEDNESNAKDNGLLWYQEASFKWKLKAKKRGIYKLGPFITSAGDFFGFYMKDRTENPKEVTVFPRILPVEEPEIRRTDLFGKAGKKSPVQDPVYILGTREYQHFQPARNIHWKASARYSRLMEKIFDPSEQEKVVVAVDTAGFFEAEAETLFERTIEAAASLLYKMSTCGYITGFVTNSKIDGNGPNMIKPGRSNTQLIKMLETMAGMNIRVDYDLYSLINTGFSLSSGLYFIVLGYSASAVSGLLDFFRHKGISATGIAALFDDSSYDEDRRSIQLLSDIFKDDRPGSTDEQ